MKRQILNVLVLASLSTMLAAPLVAQSQSPFRVKVPFEFVAGGRTLPAGEYQVQPFGGALQIRTSGIPPVILPGAVPLHDNKLTNGKVLFRRYGSIYFLSQVWKPWTSTGYEIPMSPTERDLAKGISPARVQTTIARK